MSEESATTTRSCCGRPTAEECRCYTDAADIAAAIRAFVARRARTPHDVEDITQETLLRLYRSAPNLRDEQALEGWMYRIARSAITDQYRRASVRPDPVDLSRSTCIGGQARRTRWTRNRRSRRVFRRCWLAYRTRTEPRSS